MLARRDFLVGSAAALAIGGAGRLTSAAVVDAGSIALGEARLDILSDGYMEFPLTATAPDGGDALRQLLQAHGESVEVVRVDCNLTLFRNKDQVVLFDVGAGPAFLPNTGLLTAALESMELEPSSVTHVVFTHAHPDHLWGLYDDFDELVFANAQYLISRVERDFWIDPATIDRVPAQIQSFAVGAARLLGLIAERTTVFEFDQEVLPGILSIDTRGHTPGHTAFELRSGDHSAVVLGDALTHPVISFARPDLYRGTDQDQAQSAATRRRLLDRLVAEKSRIVGFHLPHPGVGSVERAGAHFRYIAHSG